MTTAISSNPQYWIKELHIPSICLLPVRQTWCGELLYELIQCCDSQTATAWEATAWQKSTGLCNQVTNSPTASLMQTTALNDKDVTEAN